MWQADVLRAASCCRVLPDDGWVDVALLAFAGLNRRVNPCQSSLAASDEAIEHSMLRLPRVDHQYLSRNRARALRAEEQIGAGELIGRDLDWHRLQVVHGPMLRFFGDPLTQLAVGHRPTRRD